MKCVVVAAGEAVGASCYTTNGLHDRLPWPVRPTLRFCVLAVDGDKGLRSTARSGNSMLGRNTASSSELKTFPTC